MANFANSGRALVMDTGLLGSLVLWHSNTQTMLQGRILLALVEGDEVLRVLPLILLLRMLGWVEDGGASRSATQPLWLLSLKIRACSRFGEVLLALIAD